jgi:hypothetical protein
VGGIHFPKAEGMVGDCTAMSATLSVTSVARKIHCPLALNSSNTGETLIDKKSWS